MKNFMQNYEYDIIYKYVLKHKTVHKNPDDIGSLII